MIVEVLNSKLIGLAGLATENIRIFKRNPTIRHYPIVRHVAVRTAFATDLADGETLGAGIMPRVTTVTR